MHKINNVNIEGVKSFETQIKNDSSAARKTQSVEGEWILEEGNTQFVSKIKFEGGETEFKARHQIKRIHNKGGSRYEFFKSIFILSEDKL